MKSVRSIELSRGFALFYFRTTTMIKTVTYFEYQTLKAIGKKITVLRANDNTATIVIGK